jgi:DNA-binding NarL/FixJ family response regulator
VSAESLDIGGTRQDQRTAIVSASRGNGKRHGERQDLQGKAEGRAETPPVTRVLIADDHQFVSWGIAKALSALEGIDIVGSVTNGIEAIVEIRKQKPDCAILDYNMPGANGLEVFLESKRWSPGTRFVLITGSGTPQTINTLVEAGIHGVCLKDGTETEIVDLVREVCAGKTAIGASARLLMKTSAETVAVTDRELAVLQAIARGHTNASAAESLGISHKTVDSHRTNLMRKFAVNSTASLLLAAMRAGLLDPASIR